MDYAALAAQYGGTSTPPAPSGGAVDYAKLAAQYGGTTATPAKPVTTSDMWKRELMGSLPGGVVRGLKDIVDTGAGWASRLGGADEQARVQAENAAGKKDFETTTAGMPMAPVGRFVGNMLATAPVGGVIANGLRAIPGVATAIPRALTAIESAGFSAGKASPGAAGALSDIALRSLGGAVTGGASAALVNPQDAATGAMVGAAMPPAVRVAGAVGNAVGKGATGLLKHVLGVATGVGAEPISQAFKAGQRGSAEFADNMAGNVPLTDVLAKAKQGLQAMSAAKSAEYRSGMIPVGKDKTVLDFAGIDKALQDAAAVTSYKGQVKNEAAAGAVAKMRAVVDEWRGLDPAEFHTPEGLDALKQKLGGLMESIPFEEKTARLAAGKVYNATKDSINAQAPAYAGVMKDYAEASRQISEIERALSLGDKASKDTAMRKLQSLMRNNVQTNYGNRLSLANELEQKGGVDLMPALAGQAMNSWTPRSLSGQLGGGATVLAAMTHNPLMLAALPAQSPRMVGNAAYGLGRMTGAMGLAPSAVPGMPGIQQNALARLMSNNPEAVNALYRAAPVLAGGR
jgi:hypothetical protein